MRSGSDWGRPGMSLDFKPIGIGVNVYSGFAFKSSDFSDVGIPVIKIGEIGYLVY